MSRVGKMPVVIPSGVKVSFDDSMIKVEGKNGSLEQKYLPCVSFKEENGSIIVSRIDDSKTSRSCHGLYRQLLSNMIKGVSEGYSKTLLINGVGYKAEMKGNLLILSLGYSTIIEFVIPKGITIKCESPTKIIVFGMDKRQVGQICAEIRSLRSPEPYKGKGIKYEEEHIRRKVGKSSAKKWG